MAALLSGEGFRFLFRTDKGEISREVWWLGTALTGAVAVATTLGLSLLLPYARTQLTDMANGLIQPMTLAFYVYLMLYAFVIALTGVCWYNLSAKRFRAQGRAPSLAGLPLALGLVAAGAHWIARRPDTMPAWAPLTLDGLLVLVILWCVYELGIRTARQS